MKWREDSIRTVHFSLKATNKQYAATDDEEGFDIP